MALLGFPPLDGLVKLSKFEQEVTGMSYHRDLTREIAALDDLIENHLKRLEARATPEQMAVLNELKQILTLKKELLRKLFIAPLPDQQRQSESGQYLSDEIN